MSNYRTKTIEQLFCGYAFENDRACQKDADTTKRWIVKELYRRLKVSIDLLEEVQTEEEAKKIYNQFLKF